MPDRLRVLVDINVLLDVLARREPHFDASAQVWVAVETGEADGLIAAHSITTLHYLLARHTGAQRAASAMTDLLRVFDVAAVDRQVLLEALAFGWRDFEDAVQMAAAVSAGATHLITRNPTDFKGGPLPVLMPGDLLALLQAPGGALA